jgi:hypothetical protein
MTRELEPVVLTGHVLDWEELDYEEHHISERERESYEQKGFTVVEIAGNVIATREIAPDDGDVMIQSKLDSSGRMAVAGRNANFGYSGYFTGYVYVGGRRRTIVNFRKLFSTGENQYCAQYRKSDAEKAVKALFASLAGTSLERVRGGYSLAIEEPGQG